MTPLPDYTIRESARAKHVNLKITMDGGLEVVIPQGFNRQQIPDILRKKQSWIERAGKRVAERRRHQAAQPARPTEIFFRAVGETWTIEYRPTTAGRVTITEKPNHRLVLSGAVDDLEHCREALRKWTARKARQHLEPWLQTISRREKLPYEKVMFRGQKTRWGSCSSRQTISLNYKLLFLPPELVESVLIHELCHTRHLNHSAKFWALVAKKDPHYRQARKELRSAWRYLPGWVPK